MIGAASENIFSLAPQGLKEAVLAEPLECIEILGRSVADRMIERFAGAEAELVSVLVQAGSFRGKPFSSTLRNVECEVVADMNSAILHTLKNHAQRGIGHSFVAAGNVFAETDVLDLFYFHREGRRAATQARNRDGLMDLWVVNCEKAQQGDLDKLPETAAKNGPAYFVREYVNRLNYPQDLRRMASDLLRGCCGSRPAGREVKRGIWLDEGAQVDRRARIVAPAYIGRGATLREDTLLTRCSNIEEGCYIDYGTVIEDSSILKNTHVGIWLDVCQAVAEGNKLVSLKRDTVLEITDASVLRSTVKKPVTEAALTRIPQRSVVTQKEERLPGQDTCGLEANFIQG